MRPYSPAHLHHLDVVIVRSRKRRKPVQRRLVFVDVGRGLKHRRVAVTCSLVHRSLNVLVQKPQVANPQLNHTGPAGWAYLTSVLAERFRLRQDKGCIGDFQRNAGPGGLSRHTIKNALKLFMGTSIANVDRPVQDASRSIAGQARSVMTRHAPEW